MINFTAYCSDCQKVVGGDRTTVLTEHIEHDLSFAGQPRGEPRELKGEYGGKEHTITHRFKITKGGELLEHYANLLRLSS